MAHGISQSGRYRGDVGIIGMTLVIQAGPEVPKLSIVGEVCVVTVEGAVVRRIEFWSTANTVTIPEKLDPIVASVGTNKVLRRPVGGAPSRCPAAVASGLIQCPGRRDACQSNSSLRRTLR